MDIEIGTEVWRGGVNCWECDEMGHMNTRFYLARSMQGMAVLFALAGLPGAIASHRPAAVRLREMHIRFHREAPAATALHMTGGFVALGADDAEILLLLHHSHGGVLAASFRLRLSHVDADGKSAPWPAELRTKAATMMVEVPAEAQARSVSTGPLTVTAPDLAAHKRIAIGALELADCDATQLMLPQKFIGAVSDGIRQITAPLRQIIVDNADPTPARFGGAVLEFRIIYLEWPQVGDCFEIRSAFRGADKRTMAIEHWMVDAVTGRPFGFMESIAIVLDLERRKVVGITEPAQAELRPLVLA